MSRFRFFPDFDISMPFNAHLLTGNRVAWYGGFVCIAISSCYQYLAALMLIFTFLSTLVKYMLVDVLCTRLRLSSSESKCGTHLVKIFFTHNFSCKFENTVPCDMLVASTISRTLIHRSLKTISWILSII